MKPIILFFTAPKNAGSRPVREMVLFFKADVKGHKRRLANGKIITIRPYWNKRGKEVKKGVGKDVPKTTTKTGATVSSNAYNEAKKANGKYHGWLNQQRNLPIHLLEKAIRSFERLIAEHQSWLDNPTLKVSNFYQLPVGQQKHLIEKHWPDDIQRHRDSIEILKGVIREKQHDRQ